MYNLVPFKDIKKKVSLELALQQSKLFGGLDNKPFWIWNIEEHEKEDVKTKGYCCFNHIIGLSHNNIVKKPPDWLIVTS